jgi:hypothetical protein
VSRNVLPAIMYSVRLGTIPSKYGIIHDRSVHVAIDPSLRLWAIFVSGTSKKQPP